MQDSHKSLSLYVSFNLVKIRNGIQQGPDSTWNF